jgi:tryptophan halogenase
MKRRLAIVGVGSAGILSLSYFCTMLDSSWEVVSINDPNGKILGIGESSNPSFVQALENGLGINIVDDLKFLDATYKFGTMWKNWRTKDFISPLLGGNCAIHFNNFKLKELALPLLEKRWPNKFKTIKAKVTDIRNVVKGALVEMEEGSLIFDYVIDCRGFPTDYTDYNICEKMPVNHGLVHNKEIAGDWMYTGHRAHKNGWMFEIPLTNRQSYGYLFNDNITSIEDAKLDFSKEINVPIEELQNIEYKFKSYYTNKLLDGRILKNGNRAIFFEPISATSLFMYDQANRIFLSYLKNEKLTDNIVNTEFSKIANSLRELICWFYHGGSTYDTEFWRETKLNTAEVVNNSTMINNLKASYDKCLKADAPIFAEKYFFEPLEMLRLDKNFEYNYFRIYE